MKLFLFVLGGGVGEREGRRILRLQGSDDRKYSTIPKISSGAYIFQRPFLTRLCTEGNLRFKIDWASLILGRKFTVFFIWLCIWGQFPSTSPGGEWDFYLEGRFTEGFCVTSLGGLYFEGLIHGGAYFRNFTVRPTAFPRVSSVFGKWKTQLRATISRNGMNWIASKAATVNFRL